MSRTQQAAAESERNETDARPRPGGFQRLKTQPGFRTAVLAFVLTVALGAGGTAAHAYWSQPASILITAKPVPPATAVPVDVRCQSSFVNRIEWPSIAGIDSEARYIVTFDSKLLDNPVSYALPRGALRVEPFNLDLKDELGYSFREYPLKVTIQTAIVKSPSNTTVRIRPADLLFPSDPSTPVMMGYQNLGIAGFPCRT